MRGSESLRKGWWEKEGVERDGGKEYREMEWE